MHYLDHLNDEQKKAVLQTEGPLLVLAGAGTGKTRVLTTRIAHILATHRAYPDQILAVTFTNKAAREMHARLEKFLAPPFSSLPYMGTFHAIGAKILRRHAEKIGLSKNFTILDKTDTQHLIKQIEEEANLDLDSYPPALTAQYIEQWKNEGLQPEHLTEEQNYSLAAGQGQALYKSYQDRLKRMNACDFNDLLLQPIALLQKNPTILHNYHERFRYILVDEYQDTNTAQYLWLRLLAHKPGCEMPNICCVGDDDQSIYGWRGAKIQNILRFERDFPKATIIRLERNYRSTTPILSAASHLISHNEERLGKTLFSDKETHAANKITVDSTFNDKEEGYLISKKIESLIAEGHPPEEIAILIRAKFQAKILQDALSRLQIPHRLVGVESFYNRLEIKDALSYLRLVAQPRDDLAFSRVINTPKRGLGAQTLAKIRLSALKERVCFLQAAEKLVQEKLVSGKIFDKLASFVKDVERWRQSADIEPPAQLLQTILQESGYYAMWQTKTTLDTPDRLNALKELCAYAKQFKDLQSLLEEISLLTDKSDVQEGKHAVSIMTLHAAKGLEFMTVFLPGWEENLFPHANALNMLGKKGEEALEEERRLAYVGITRAKRNLHISYTHERFVHGETKNYSPSRFLKELPAEHVDKHRAATVNPLYGRNTNSFYPAPFAEDSSQKTLEQLRWEKSKRSFSSAHLSNFCIGERVFNIKFGPGTIIDIEGDKLEVSFDKAGHKRILQTFVERIY